MTILITSVIIMIVCNVRGEYLDKSKGSPCEWMNAQGTCVSARRCDSFLYDHQKKRTPPICSFEGKEPVICCIDCKILDKESSIKDPLDRENYVTDRKYERKCFEYEYPLPYTCKIPSRYDYSRVWNETNNCYEFIKRKVVFAVGSEDALREEFPHMALLGYGPELESAQWLCGGSLISEKFILTAGHCASSSQLGPVTYVALGMLKRSDPPHFWKRYKVKRFIPHPEYNPPIKYNDIALIETEISINFTEGVRPACLTHKPEFPGDEIAYATGWGALGPHKENADVLQKVFLKKFSAEECATQYPMHRHLPRGYNHTTQICYGDYKEVKDTCQGDSGGPLQNRDYDARYCPYVIIGVTSTGRQCGKPGAAGIYTRAHHYVPWIESVVWPNYTW